MLKYLLKIIKNKILNKKFKLLKYINKNKYNNIKIIETTIIIN